MHRRRPRRSGSAWALAWLILGGPARADDPAPKASPEAVRTFETEVRPVLARNCIPCHGPAKQGGKLRLDSRAGAVAGGDGGPAVVPGRPEESPLVAAIDYEGPEMPPKGQLPQAEREALRRWVTAGCPWPEGDPPPAPAESAARPKITDEDRAFWSFRPVRRPEVPTIADGGWGRNPIDRFVFERLAREGLAPAPEADRATLIRRLSFDLLGLPPRPDEVDAFVADGRPEAYEALVERMLASPHYGERWGRHWLDLVRYADSDGYNEDAERPDAFRYRDYVVDALNADKPYDRFVAEQVAGDEIDPDSPEMRVAVGYFRLGTYEHNQRDVPGQWDTILNDITDVTGDAFLGMGFACARCHDHKFDPILRRDYFRLRAFFEPILPRDDLDIADAESRAAHARDLARWEAEAAPLLRSIAELERPVLEKEVESAFTKFPADIQGLLKRTRAERTPGEHQIAELAYRQILEVHEDLPLKMKKAPGAKEWEALRSQLKGTAMPRPAPLPGVMTVRDVGPDAPPTVIPGDRSREAIEPGYLTLLDPGPAAVPPVPNSTGRRSALAAWIGRADNPLTARVMVNRIWQGHFGRGVVATASDFGRKGDRPTHPELLDWLASEFVARGWSIKAMHRLIVGSSTYRQSARSPMPERTALVDPENRLLGRSPVRRLEVEPIHDALLAASGELVPTLAGPAGDVNGPRRMIYAKVLRNKRDPLGDGFDAPDSSSTTPRRNVSTTALQVLLMANGPWGLDRARAFARRLRAAEADDAARVELAYRLAFGRRPDASEQADAANFLAEQAGRAGGGEPGAERALVDFCHALFNSSEFVYID